MPFMAKQISCETPPYAERGSAYYHPFKENDEVCQTSPSRLMHIAMTSVLQPMSP